jgi:hypothetical protein
LDDDKEHPFLSITTPATRDWQQFRTIFLPVKKIQGKHRLTLLFAGNGDQAANVDWLTFSNTAN